MFMQNDILPTCRELGIAVLAYSPLGRGFLTGTAQKDKPYLGPHPWWDNYDKVTIPTSADAVLQLALSSHLLPSILC